MVVLFVSVILLPKFSACLKYLIMKMCLILKHFVLVICNVEDMNFLSTITYITLFNPVRILKNHNFVTDSS